jgi:hypothetical protein
MRQPSQRVLGRSAFAAAALFIVASCSAGATQPQTSPVASAAASVAPATAGQSATAPASLAPSAAGGLSASGGLPSAISTRTVKIAAVGSSGVSGTATLSDLGDGRTMVAITVADNYNRDMPTAITRGTCPRFGATDESKVSHLNDTRDGTGTTVIPRPLTELLADPYEIRLYTAGDDLSPAACGDIK